MISPEEIIQVFQKRGKEIMVKKKNKNQLILFISNQDLTIEIYAKQIIIKGNKDSNNTINDTAENAEKIKEILKKFLKECEIKEIIIEIQ